MEYNVYYPNESPTDTLGFIEERYSRERENILLSECSIYQRGKYIIVQHDGLIYYYEHDGTYCYILDAIHFIKPELPANWKTLDKLITLRQAIRECTAQGMGLEDMYQIEAGLSEKQYDEFIEVARVYDKRHHGDVTF